MRNGLLRWYPTWNVGNSGHTAMSDLESNIAGEILFAHLIGGVQMLRKEIIDHERMYYSKSFFKKQGVKEISYHIHQAKGYHGGILHIDIKWRRLRYKSHQIPLKGDWWK